MLPKVMMLVLLVVCILADVISWLCMLASIITGGKRAYTIALAKDQVYNAVIGGHIDEKISSRAWRLKDTSKRWHYARILIDWLFWFDKDHCQKSFKNELLEHQLYADKAHIYLAKRLQTEKANHKDYLT
jgi:hypothetical protein